MSAPKKQKEVFEIGDLIDGKQEFSVKYAFLRLNLRLINQEDFRMADVAAMRPGDNPKKPKRDEDVFALELLRRCVVSFEHIDGKPIAIHGTKIKNTIEDLKTIADSLPGLANFIFTNCRDTDKMYSTLEEKEIKN